MTLSDIPVVLFVYRRPDILRQVLECFRADGVPLLHIFSDGPRSAALAEEVAAVRHLIRSIDWCECVVEESQTNLGLGVSVKRGVSAAIQRYGSAIIFEDDLISVPGTYRYLAAALRRYEDDPRVMSVTAWTHPRIVPNNVGASPYFDGKGECWAWGTWARAWEGMDDPALAIMRECQEMGIDIEQYGTDMPKMAAEAEPRNLWAIGWWYHHLRRQGLCLRPPWSLVDQICWEEERSTTSTPAMLAWANPPLRPCPPIPDMWPEPREHPLCAPLWRQAIDG
jgi:hypothetical protein